MNITPLQSLMLNDSGFAFHPETGESFQVSETGSAIIRLLLAGVSEEELAEKISEAFDVDLAVADRDIEGFLLSLQNMNLILI
jgi:hypothetical protein